jgi:hypothetical protein
MANSNGSPDWRRGIIGAVVVVAGLLAIGGVFAGTIVKFGDAKDVVAVLGAVTGVIGTVITAFFGIHATAAAGADASKTLSTATRDSQESAQTFAANMNPDYAKAVLDDLQRRRLAAQRPSTSGSP